MKEFIRFLKIGFEIGTWIAKTIWNVLAFIFGLFFKDQDSTPDLPEKYEGGFSEARDVLREKAPGFCLNGKYSLSLKESLQAAIAIGSTGYGKTVSVLLPTIYKMATQGFSVCVHDPSAELYFFSSGWLNRNGYKTIIIHFDKPEISDGFNPLARIKDDDITAMQKIASMLVTNAQGTNQTKDFWTQTSVLFITLCIALVMKGPTETRHLASVKFLLDSYLANQDGFDILVAKSGSSYIKTEYKNFLMTEPKVMASVISTCRASLGVFSSPNVQKVTSFDSINMEDLRAGKLAIFVQNKTLDIPFYSVLSSIFFEQVFSFLMENLPLQTDNHVFFLLDEFSSIRIPTIQLAISNLRKFKSNCLCIIQGEDQIRHQYGVHDGNALLSGFHTKIFFPNQPIDTCRQISEILGKREFEFKDELTGRKHMKVRNVLEPSEVKKLSEDRAIIFVGTRVMYAKMHPYYQNKLFKSYSEIPPVELTRKVPFDVVPLIKF